MRNICREMHNCRKYSFILVSIVSENLVRFVKVNLLYVRSDGIDPAPLYSRSHLKRFTSADNLKSWAWFRRIPAIMSMFFQTQICPDAEKSIRCRNKTHISIVTNLALA